MWVRRGRRRLDWSGLRDWNASQDRGRGEVAVIKGDVRTVEELRGTKGDALDRCHFLGSGEQRLILLHQRQKGPLGRGRLLPPAPSQNGRS